MASPFTQSWLKGLPVKAACPSAAFWGKSYRSTAHGESDVNEFSDRGSTPLGSTRKELRIVSNPEFFQLYPFLSVTDDIANAMIYAPHMIYAPRMKISGTDIIPYLRRKYITLAKQVYHTRLTSISYLAEIYH